MNNIVHGIAVDYSRDSLFSESRLSRLTENILIAQACAKSISKIFPMANNYVSE